MQNLVFSLHLLAFSANAVRRSRTTLCFKADGGSIPEPAWMPSAMSASGRKDCQSLTPEAGKPARSSRQRGWWSFPALSRQPLLRGSDSVRDPIFCLCKPVSVRRSIDVALVLEDPRLAG
jgi:hypothetical protein